MKYSEVKAICLSKEFENQFDEGSETSYLLKLFKILLSRNEKRVGESLSSYGAMASLSTLSIDHFECLMSHVLKDDVLIKDFGAKFWEEQLAVIKACSNVVRDSFFVGIVLALYQNANIFLPMRAGLNDVLDQSRSAKDKAHTSAILKEYSQPGEKLFHQIIAELWPKKDDRINIIANWLFSTSEPRVERRLVQWLQDDEHPEVQAEVKKVLLFKRYPELAKQLYTLIQGGTMTRSPEDFRVMLNAAIKLEQEQAEPNLLLPLFAQAVIKLSRLENAQALTPFWATYREREQAIAGKLIGNQKLVQEEADFAAADPLLSQLHKLKAKHFRI